MRSAKQRGKYERPWDTSGEFPPDACQVAGIIKCSGRGRVDVFTCKDRITKVVPWSILGGTSVQRIGTKDEEGSI